MNITLNTKINKAGIALVAGVLPKSHNLPCLTHVRLSGNENEVSICSSDIDIHAAAVITTEAPATFPPGLNQEVYLLPGRNLVDLFKRGNRLTIETNCKKAEVTLDGNKFSMSQLGPEDFPIIPQFTPDLEADLVAEAVLTALVNVQAAQSTDKSRYVLNGICIHVEPASITLVATDGRRLHNCVLRRSPDEAWLRRLAVAKQELDEMDLDEKKRGVACSKEREKLRLEYDLAQRVQFIIPSDAVPHLIRLLKAQPKDGAVLMEYKTGEDSAKPGFVRFSTETMLVATKCLVADYPNWRQVIPSEAKEFVAVPVDEWINAIRTVEPCTSAKCTSVKITLENDEAAFTAKSPDNGEGKATVRVNFRGNAYTGAFNPLYLLEALAPHKGATYPVTFSVVDELTPCVITTETTTTVIMPMRLS